ncbi:iron complex transport system substrate-binding protein [Eubacterium aggregans]|uniref:Iron complex transport system substrate-binding protein n=1 Tax=Eubacterium aggregans TaxID=81409 RepID=A0A1H4EA55_9FIRM|nr:ABC transporter substrate-binding protein [Eubacterium aggregans]SEA81915.1 iron complex transport system substrate-binding protein [Eubacterium aggregans]
MKKRICIIVALLLAALVCGCGQKPGSTGETRTVTDALGRSVEIPVTVERIVPLGNTPRMITYLGLADKVVAYGGMDADTISPLTAYAYVNKDQWKDLPKVGTDAMGNTDYYPEEIIAANPDVILCTYTEDMVNDLSEKTGLPVIAVGQGTLFGEDYAESLRILGEVCGAEKRATEVIAYINDTLADLNKRTADIPQEEKPRVLSAAATFKGAHGIEGVRLDDPVLTAVNANNIAAASATGKAATVEVDKEQILAWNPDVIFCDYGGVALVKKDVQANPDFYAQLKSYQDNKIYQYPSSTSYFSNVEIPLANGYFVGSILYPEKFTDVDLTKKSNEIFKFFLGVEDYMSVLNDYGAGYGAVDFGQH